MPNKNNSVLFIRMIPAKIKTNLCESPAKRWISVFLTFRPKAYFCCMENIFEANQSSVEKLSFDSFRNEVLQDYRWVCLSREASLIGRKEVLTGKAKFGIF